jgi:putative transposase
MPKNGYENETAANDSVRDYIYKYYNSVRPHSHNLGLSPNEKEAFYWKTSNWVTKKG